MVTVRAEENYESMSGQPVFGMKCENFKERLEPHFQVAEFTRFN
jgi:hypothetical protein